MNRNLFTKILLILFIFVFWFAKPRAQALAMLVTSVPINIESTFGFKAKRKKNSVDPENLIASINVSGNSQSLTDSESLSDVSSNSADFVSSNASSTASIIDSSQSASDLLSRFGKHTSAILGKIYVESLVQKTYQYKDKISFNVSNTLASDFSVKVLDKMGREAKVNIYEKDFSDKIQITLNPSGKFTPGKYTLEVTQNGQVVSSEDFSWGVLAINTNKSIYTPNEKADIAMAVLDQNGDLVCDAKVILVVTDPGLNQTKLTTESGEIQVNPTCSKKIFTLTPDYETSYQIATQSGQYSLSLTAETKNGKYSVTDSFEVKKDSLFDVERVASTRIYPPLTYPVELKIKAQNDFSGKVTEVVPESFTVSTIKDPNILKPESIKTVDTNSVMATFSSQIQNVLGARVLSMPFSATASVSLGFGEDLALIDPAEKGFYQKYGLAGHDGMDFSMPEGTSIKSVDDGTVILASENGDYGWTMVVEHSWGRSYYGHLSEFTKKVGDKVSKNEEIAKSGATGHVTGAHLHFSIKPNNPDMQNGYYGKIDPAPLLGLPTDGRVLGASTIGQNEKSKVITWNINVKKGETITLGYQFKAPKVSPQFYTLGPARFFDQNQNQIFEEARKWQVAADSPTFDTSSRFSGSGTTVSSSYTVGSGANLMVLGIITHNNVARTGGAPTYNGVELTQIGDNKFATETNVEMWYLRDPDTGASHTVSIPNAGSLTVYAHVSTYISDSGKEFALDTYDGYGSTAATANPSLTLTLLGADEVVVDVLGDGYLNAPSANSNTLLYKNDNGSYSDNSQYGISTGAGDITFSWTVSADDWSMIMAAFKQIDPIEQEGYRFREDNGSETTATWIDSQDTAITRPIETNTRLRTILNTAGNPVSTQFQLGFKKSTDSDWHKVPLGSTVYNTPSQIDEEHIPATDNTANTGPTITFTPPGTMQTGDLVVVAVHYRSSSVTISNSDDGGQTWTATSQQTQGTTNAFRVFYTTFNGTWSSNPAFTVGSGTVAMTGQMYIFRNASSTLDVAASLSGYAATSTVTITGVTTNTDNALVLALWSSQDNNTWGTLTSGWYSPGIAYIRNTSNGSISGAYQVMSDPGSTGNVSKTQTSTGPDAGVTAIMAFEASSFAAPVMIYASSNITANGENTTPQLTPPSGKTTGDFTTGQMQDDINPANAVDIGSNGYTELEWNLQFTADASLGDIYDFRITRAGVPLTTYSLYPEVTIGTAGAESATLDKLMRHGKWFNSSGVIQPFTF